MKNRRNASRRGILLIVVLLTIFCLIPLSGWADYDYPQKDYDISEDDLIAISKVDFPDWYLVNRERYWAGSWNDETACWIDILLMQVKDSTLYQKKLSVIVNSLRKGEHVPWEITDYAPIPLTEAAVNTLLDMEPTDLYRDQDGYTAEPCRLSWRITSECATFLLSEGEAWIALYSYPTTLAGIVINTEGQKCIRIAHWDGKQYCSVISSRFFSEERLSINGWQSNGNIVTVSCGACDPQFARQPDGRWLFVGIGDGNWTLYRVYDDFVTDAFALTLHDSNDVIHYGEFALERELTNADFTAYPDYIRDVIPLLDSSEFACVRSDGTPMWESPNGKLLATCYARLTGRIIQHENGYVQLQIGSEEYGMVGWFEEDDLAFGMDIEAVRCGFPSHSEEDCNRDYLVHVLNDVDLAEFTNTTCLVWLIGEKPEGNWLVQLNVETVCTASADSFRNIGPASELWAQFEAEYDHFEQEMQKGVGEAYDRPGK